MLNKFKLAVTKVLPSTQIIEDEILRYAYATDASLYRMLPQLVLVVKQELEIVAIINLARKYNTKLTFRAAGTSLSGQAVTDQVLVMLAPDSWLNYQINDYGNEIMLEPGIIGAAANNYLKPYAKQIGPDPGSLNSAKIGGIIANNSSGMCCGTNNNSYATLKSLRAILANGTIFDSSDIQHLEQFKLQNKEFLHELSSLRQQILVDPDLVKFIRKKFSIKNTSGYSLNAFLDFGDPVKILEHLMVGSEGTLGFISRVTLATVPNYAHKGLNLIYGNLQDLIQLTLNVANLDVAAIELLDYFSLQSIATASSIQKYLIVLPDSSFAAIMLEVRAASSVELQAKIAQVEQIVSCSKVYHQTEFICDELEVAALWQVRGGVLATLAGQRPLGSSVLIEDVAVAMPLLPDLISDLRVLFKRYGFDTAAIFGHVLAGNIHFVLTPNFADPAQVQAYADFMQEFTDLVANKYHGSLKAEHGSGRNISPFARVEWGDKCWDLMWKIKELFDPKAILNPDVKLTREPSLHLQHLKLFAAVDAKINKCMECGFCESVCPSRSLSLTPRQRITLARKISTLAASEKLSWQKKYQYLGIDTCATTGMCQTACPVGINTGAFILAQQPPQYDDIDHAAAITRAKTKVKLANLAAAVIGRKSLHTITSLAHNQFKSIPIYVESMPEAQTYRFENRDHESGELLLIPACPNRIFAAAAKHADYPSKLVLTKMGYKVSYLSNVQAACCGQIYHSNANQLQQQQMLSDLRLRLKAAKLAIIDNSSCFGFAQAAGINLIDINTFIVEHLDRNKIIQKYQKIALHIDCSIAKYSFSSDYLQVLQRCSAEVIIPEGIKCCGFAGDKGFLVPELNASSLSKLARQVTGCELGVTFNRSCQIGLTLHGQIQYISFVELVLNCLA